MKNMTWRGSYDDQRFRVNMMDTFGTIRAFTFTTIYFDQKLIVIYEFERKKGTR